MKLLCYIKKFHPECKVSSVMDLTDEEFKHYYTLMTSRKKVKQPAEKTRKDKGVKRTKYDNTLPKGYLSYLKRANRKSIQFDLTVEQYNQTKYMQCVYCGDQATGIDRIDSSEGYVEGNMQPCCSVCNLMKFNRSEETFLRQIAKIHNHRLK